MYRRRKGVITALLIVACLALVGELAYIWPYYEFGAFGTHDFIQYWSAGQLLRQGKNPYDFDALYSIERMVGWPLDDPLIMWNPPWTLPLALPFNLAALVWLCMGLAVTFGCSAAAWQLFAPQRFPRQVPVAWLATVVFMPALFTLVMGQISSLILLGVTGFLLFAMRGIPTDYSKHQGMGGNVLAGAFLALTMVKPHVVYLLLITVGWWVVTRRR